MPMRQVISRGIFHSTRNNRVYIGENYYCETRIKARVPHKHLYETSPLEHKELLFKYKNRSHRHFSKVCKYKNAVLLYSTSFILLVYHIFLSEQVLIIVRCLYLSVLPENASVIKLFLR